MIFLISKYIIRDGVGEGYFSKVLNHELKAIKDVCNEKNINVKITYIMVINKLFEKKKTKF